MRVYDGNLPSVAKLDEMIIAGNKAIHDGLWKEAVMLFDRAIKLKPQYVVGWLGKASAQIGTQDHNGALESYHKALEVDAGSKEAWCGLIDALHKLGHYDEEVEACDCLLRLSPRSDDVLLNKGVALHSLGKLEKALECFEQVAERRPENASALNNKGAALLGLGRFQESLDAFETALALVPDNEEVQKNRCLLLLRLGRFGAAVLAADEMLKAKEGGWLLMLKGLAHAELREIPLAIKSLERAKELSPELESLDETLRKARSLGETLNRSQTEVAPETSKGDGSAPGTDPTRVPPQALATILCNLGFPSESLRLWKECVREEHPYDWLSLGRTLIASGEKDMGDKCLAEAHRLGQGTISENLTPGELPSAWREISKRASAGWTEDAANLLEKMLDEKPDLEKSWRWLGVMKAAHGKLAEAESAFRKVSDLESGSPTALNNLGAVLICSGKINEASEVLRNALKMNSNSPEILHNLAIVESSLGRYEEARELLHMSLRIEERPTTLVVLGGLLESINRNREASECYKKCLSMEPRNRLAIAGMSRTKAKLQSRRKTSEEITRIKKTARTQPKKKGKPGKSPGR